MTETHLLVLNNGLRDKNELETMPIKKENKDPKKEVKRLKSRCDHQLKSSMEENKTITKLMKYTKSI